MASFAVGETDFLLDGRPHRILSGAIHYFRVHPDLWADRIRKARLMGLNTIETYVAWNAHEPRRGEWDETGWNDLGRFLDLVAAEGLHAIVRPGPYICAEWHNGGLPVWLTGIPGIGLRRSEPQYLAEVREYLRRVYRIVQPRQIDRGGPVILVQIENEYGAYGSDEEYLRELVRVTRDADITVPLTTIDQPTPEMLSGGGLDGLHATASFGSRAPERLAALRAHQRTGPLMCAEFWDGWFDWWGGHHHTTSATDAAAELDSLLAAGASVNFYMFHGGTNFGLTNGANDKGRYLPIVTSYDYDAPLDEAGNPSEKYFAFRDVIGRYADVPSEVPPSARTAPRFEVELAAAILPDVQPESGAPVRPAPPTFEQLGHLSALVRYEVDLPESSSPRLLTFEEVRDQAWAAVDGVAIGTMSRTGHDRSIVVPPGKRLSLIVEEQGRVNYAERIGEHKGLIGVPRLDGVPLEGWTATPIDVGALGGAAVAAEDGAAHPAGLTILSGRFQLEEPVDLFVDTSEWGAGFAVVNGFLLGRYRRTGPQRTLYIPAPVLSAGANSIVVIEMEHVTAERAVFVAGPRLGPTEE